jgi:hypothetical protein
MGKNSRRDTPEQHAGGDITTHLNKLVLAGRAGCGVVSPPLTLLLAAGSVKKSSRLARRAANPISESPKGLPLVRAAEGWVNAASVPTD